MERELKYGCNPNQSPAKIFLEGRDLPLTVLNGSPGYINLLDALNGWQLVRELRTALRLPAAASYKHTSPAGAAVGLPLSETLRKMYFVDQQTVSPLAAAYIRARGADRLSSFGDFAALSEPCDVSTALYLAKEVSDGVIAPGYEPEALEILKKKRKGGFTVLMIDPAYEPKDIETRELFGISFQQRRNNAAITVDMFENIVTANRNLPAEAKRDLALAMITLKYTQSNSVCYAEDGQAIGVGAGQQSRIHCTRLAGNKADLWHLRSHPAVLGLPFKDGIGRSARDNAVDIYLTGETPDMPWQELYVTEPKPLAEAEKTAWLKRYDRTALASDAFFPFGDNIERAARSGVKYIAQPGGSVRDDQVIARCDAHQMVMAFTNLRLFYH